NQILRYHQSDGSFVGVVDPSRSGNLDGPECLARTGSGLLATSSSNDSILQYSYSGTFLGAFVSSGTGGLGTPWGLAFGPDGNLYVTSHEGGSILRYQGATGAFIGIFVQPGSGGLVDALTLAFGPDGNLYVADAQRGILRYDGGTGNFLGIFVSPGS